MGYLIFLGLDINKLKLNMNLKSECPAINISKDLNVSLLYLTKIVLFLPNSIQKLYSVSNTKVLSCYSYEWLVNGEAVDLNDQHITMAHDSGELTLGPAMPYMQGYYQCFARNQYGTALSRVTFVERAGMQTIITTSLINAYFKWDFIFVCFWYIYNIYMTKLYGYDRMMMV